MSIGNAIIVSTLLVIAAVFMWRISIARRWGTVGKVFGALFLIILAIVGGFQSYLWYLKLPKKIDNLSSIRIGMNEAEVIVNKGSPNSEDIQNNFRIISYRKTYDTQYGLDILVSKKDNKVETVCEQGDYTDSYLNDYITEAELTNRFGKPNSSFIEPDGSHKALSYPKYNLTFIIRSGKLSEVCLSNRAQGYLK